MISDAERNRVVAAAEKHHDETVSFLQEMIRTPSVNPPGEYEAIHELVRERYESYGWECETVWTPEDVLEELGLDPAYPRPNLLSYVSRGDGPTIALNAHFDTVPIDDAEAWSYDPFGGEIDGDRVYGRGAMDSKGRIAAYTLAARALEASELLPEEATVVLAITCDEETGGEAGPGYVVDSGALEPDYAIVEGVCETIWHSTSGVLNYRVDVEGKASHAGVSPEKGANAIIAASYVLQELERYADELTREESSVANVGSPTCVPSIIGGGVKTNVVPARCSIEIDQRVPPDMDEDEQIAALTEAVTDVTLPAGTSATVTVTERIGSYYTEPQSDHVQSVKKNAEAIFGREMPVTGIRGGSDARFFAQADAKTLNFGPGDMESNPHGADENISLSQVRDAGATVAASIVDASRS